MCDFCEEYKYADIEARQNEEHFITEIGVKMIVYKKKKSSLGVPASSTLGKVRALNYCPVCGHNFAQED